LKVEIVAVGDEILSGNVIDTNSSYISLELHKLGIAVSRMTVISDSRDEIVKALKNGMSRSDVVILTGGLGATHDDITRKTVSSFLGRRLVLNDQILMKVKNHFRKKGIDMPEVNTSQALVPRGAIVLDNPIGTAPGFIFEEKSNTVILLPGVPAETKVIFKNSLLEYFKKGVKDEFTLSQTIHTTGISESEIYERLGDIPKENICFIPKFTGVDIRIKAKGSTEKKAKNNLSKISEKIIDKVDEHYYGTDNETMERVIGILLSMRRKTLSIAESCTAGLIMKRLTDIPGSSDYFNGGVVAYSNDAKINILKVKSEYIEQKGAVSKKVAEEMAKGVRKLLGSNFGLSVTGIAGPSGGTEKKPLGLVYIGISDKKKNFSKEYKFTGTRETIREQAAQAALDLLRRRLLGI
jgi:nicotinamide-nucleotide amidase